MKPWHVALGLWSFGTIAGVLLAGEAVPAATAAQWLADPQDAARRAGSAAEHLNGMGPGGWAAVAIAALTVLGLAKRYAPLVSAVLPGWGKLIEAVANVGWHLASTRQQKAAEEAVARTAAAVDVAAPVLAIIARLPPERIPTELLDLMARPEVKQAIAVLAAPTRTTP